MICFQYLPKINKVLFSGIVPEFQMVNQRFQCPRCPKIYKHRFILARHLNYECGIEPQFSCKYCKFRGKRKYELKNHYIKFHGLLASTLP